MTISCMRCGREGTLDQQSYTRKRLRLRCPYCAHEFVFAGLVSRNGSGTGAAVAVLSQAEQEELETAVFEAKRIARLIISEIKLYNQEKIEKAESQKEILELLKHDLTRGKDHYNGRVASRLPADADYFMDTVKEILLAGKN